MNNLLKRSLSGIVYVVIFVSAILFSQASYTAITCLFGAFCIWEFSKMIGFKNFASYLLFGLFVFFLIKKQQEYPVFGVLLINILYSLYLVYKLFSKTEITFRNDRSKLGVTLRYIVLSMSFLVILPVYKGVFEPKLVLAIVVLIWINDSFAFLVGKNLGKRKLFESVSPKKTIEGFVGGLVFSIVASYFIAEYMPIFSVVNWLIIAVIVSVFGTIGDLIESKFKRQANIKDSGNIMPGHGGILDRLDSLLFVAPFIYLYFNFII